MLTNKKITDWTQKTHAGLSYFYEGYKDNVFIFTSVPFPFISSFLVEDQWLCIFLCVVLTLVSDKEDVVLSSCTSLQYRIKHRFKRETNKIAAFPRVWPMLLWSNAEWGEFNTFSITTTRLNKFSLIKMELNNVFLC